MIFERKAYLEKLLARRGNGFVKVITGVRRCGKSFLLFKLYKKQLMKAGMKADQFIEVALDDDRNERLRDPRALSAHVRGLVKGNRASCLFIDEIQLCREVPLADGSDGKLTFYDVLNGLMKLPKLDIYVTGSNSRMLSKDVATHFRDRGDVVQLHPLTFSEYHAAVKGDVYRDWNDYLVYGGMPEAVLKKTPEEKSAYLAGLFESTYLRDIVERHGLRDDYALERTVDVVSSVVGSLTNPTRLAHAMQNELSVRISIPTVKNYLEYLVDSFLFRKADRYDVKGRRYLDYPSKYYAEDVGLRNARLNFRQTEVDHLMENVIYNELIVRGANVDVGVVEVREMTDGRQVRKQYEIDFVVNLGRGKVYIQSAYALPTDRKRAQETSSLERSGDSFRKVVVVGTPQPKYTDDKGIAYIGVMDFLLDPSVLDDVLK